MMDTFLTRFSLRQACRNSHRISRGFAGWQVVAVSLLLMPLCLVANRENWVPDTLIEQADKEYGRLAMFRMERWRDMLYSAANLKDDLDKLERVNNFFNKEVPYRFDKNHWKVVDYWATPYEMLGTNGGDCEDYVIAKYYSLLKIGLDSSRVRFNYVKALEYNQAHMVLTYYPTPNAIPLVLDNLDRSIRSADKRTDLKPVYSFNLDSMWLDEAVDRSIRLGESNKIDRWTDLRTRMAAIGMEL